MIEFGTSRAVRMKRETVVRRSATHCARSCLTHHPVIHSKRVMLVHLAVLLSIMLEPFRHTTLVLILRERWLSRIMCLWHMIEVGTSTIYNSHVADDGSPPFTCDTTPVVRSKCVMLVHLAAVHHARATPFAISL